MIDTPRLRLRAHRVADFERYLALYTHREPDDAPSPLVLGEEDTWYRLLRFVGHWAHFGYGLFLVEDRHSGELIGEAGLAHFHRCLGSRFDAVPEAGWKVLRERRGQGIASEAMLAIQTWFDAHTESARTVCMIHPENLASLRVAARLGYREFERARYRNDPVVLLERMRSR